jgi:hypothetical protein
VDESTSSDPDSLNWSARILLELAEPILESLDIRQALAQSETDADVLRDLVISHSDALICSSSSVELDFVERIDWDILPVGSRRWRQILAASIALLMIAVGVTISTSQSPVLVLLFGFSIVGILSVPAALCLTMAEVKAPLEPSDTTRDVLRREVVGPFMREQINHILAEQEHSDVMRVTSAPGLADLSDREQLVTTYTMRQLARFSRSMSSGSIGLSGPRGVGKTTLLQYFCDPLLGAGDGSQEAFSSPQDLRIIVSAPVEYDTRDFILHLFGKLCEAVLAINQASVLIHMPSAGDRRGGRRTFALLACMLLIFGLGVTTYAMLRPRHLPRLTKYDAYLYVGCIALIAGAAMLARWAWLISFSHRIAARSGSIMDEARGWLTRIRYLQTLTTGYSGSMRIPAGAELALTKTRQLAELQLTLPDLVDRYREFAGRAILWRRSQFISGAALIQAHLESRRRHTSLMRRRADLLSRMTAFLQKSRLTRPVAALTADFSDLATHNAAEARGAVDHLQSADTTDAGPRILIGIDEIDKIGTDSAQHFLNDIKAIFGVPYCLYLVSVSDEALTVFEQRALLGRTAFDSTFDEVIRARELNFESCRHLLRRRIAGMPDSLIGLCEVMSGGLPRDLIREARSVVEACAQGQTQIIEITLSIVIAEIGTLKRTCIVEMSGSDRGTPARSLLASLLRDDWPGTSVRSMLEAVQADLVGAPIPLRFATALYLYATIAEIFGSKLPATMSSLRRYRPDEASCIDRLAHARNMISVNGDVAWELISHFRTARGLLTLDRPEPPGRLAAEHAPEPEHGPQTD